MYNKFLKDDKGFTGLEAAIVLIAFVVVAAVFSYVMLGAGFFTTQKSQEVVHTGVTQASSSIAPSGDVIAKGADHTFDYTDNTGGTLLPGACDSITFYITNTAGGTSVDLDKTIITYTDDNNFVTCPYTNAVSLLAGGALGPLTTIPAVSAAGAADWAKTTGWAYTGIITTDGIGKGDNLLSAGEKYKVVIWLPQLLSFSGIAGQTAGTADLTGTSQAGAKLPQTNGKFKIEVKPPEGAVLTVTKTLPAALAENNYYAVY